MNEEGHLYDISVSVFVGYDSYEAEGMRNAKPEYCIPSMWRTLLTIQHACSGTKALTDKKSQ